MNDDMWFDVPRKRIYVTGTETLSILEQHDADHYTRITDIPTGYRAKTSLLGAPTESPLRRCVRQGQAGR